MDLDRLTMLWAAGNPLSSWYGRSSRSSNASKVLFDRDRRVGRCCRFSMGMCVAVVAKVRVLSALPTVLGGWLAIIVPTHVARWHGGALLLFEEVAVVKRRIYGDEHRSTLCAINSLACLHEEMKNYAQALVLYTECLAAGRRTLGDEDTDALDFFNNLGVVHFQMGSYDLALPLY